MELLWVSNGHGEDVIGARLVKTYEELYPDVSHTVMPLVGLGGPYRATGAKLLEPRRELPSGGFSGRSPRFLFQDLSAGLGSLTRKQRKVLGEQRQEGMVVVGDSYAFFMAVKAPVRPLIFLPTAKSDHIQPHYAWEVKYMKKHADQVLARDARTAQSLAQNGVPASYVGNVMMDAISPEGVDFGLASGPTVAILPGSRKEAAPNAALLLAGAVELSKLFSGKVNFLLSRSPHLELSDLMADLSGDWSCEEAGGGAEAKLTNGEIEVLVSTHFSDLITQADLIFGMAGTANEQAAGLGKPIVTCPGSGPQFTERFLWGQARLLGDAVAAVSPEPLRLAAKAKEILEDPELYAQMGRVGKERMGEPGATKRMVEIIAQFTGAGI